MQIDTFKNNMFRIPDDMKSLVSLKKLDIRGITIITSPALVTPGFRKSLAASCSRGFGCAPFFEGSSHGREYEVIIARMPA